MGFFDLYTQSNWRNRKQLLSPLHLAVIHNRPDQVKALLDAGAEDKEDRWGITPSHLSKLLSRSNMFSMRQDRSILIYQHTSKQICEMSVAEFETKLGLIYVDTLIFDSIETIHKVAKKCVRKMKDADLRKMNAWTLALHQNDLKKSRDHLVYVRWIDSVFGYGIFAAKDLPAFTYIGEYTGVVKRRKRRKNRLNDYVFSYDVCGQTTRWCIDAKKRGNLTRFLNHSDSPNLTSHWVIQGGISHIIFFTNQRIVKGTQLTYCYGPWYWRSRPKPFII